VVACQEIRQARECQTYGTTGALSPKKVPSAVSSRRTDTTDAAGTIIACINPPALVVPPGLSAKSLPLIRLCDMLSIAVSYPCEQ